MSEEGREKLITALFDAAQCLLDERILSEVRIFAALCGRNIAGLNTIADVRDTLEKMRDKGKASRVGYDLWEVRI